jgi:hypothetical protein
MKTIEFIYNGIDFVDAEKPVPAKSLIPEWYKDVKPYNGSSNKFNFNLSTGKVDNSTIKKCMPVLDSITAGYLIKTYCDIQVVQDNGYPFYQWPETPTDEPAISFHGLNQLPGHPYTKTPYIAKNSLDIPKFNNLWSIKTPPGYSCLFITPSHHDVPIIILPGIVDTDKYYGNIKLPFVLKDPKFEGLIEMGTPIVQVIPFKRDEWESDFYSKNNKPFVKHIRSMFVDGYKKIAWSRKNYN